MKGTMDRYSRTHKIALYILVCLLTLYTIWKGIIPAWKELNSDFPNYYLSSKIVLEGKDMHRLYEDAWFNQKLQELDLAEQGKFSPFPPATAFVMLPIASLKPLTAKRIWTICNICFLLLTIYFLQKITAWHWIFCALLILLTGQALLNNFRLGQLYLMVGCTLVFSHYLVQRGKTGIAGSLLGIVAIIKYFPVVFIAGYAFTGNRRLTIYAISTMLVLVFLQIGVVGTGVFATYLAKVLLPHLQGDLSMQSPYAIAFQSWESVLRNVFVFHPTENPSPLINWPTGKWMVQGIMYACIALTTIYVLWQSHFLQKPVKQWIYLSLPALAAFVLSPASATYHYLMLVFPFAFILLVLKAGEASIVITGWFILLYMGIGWLNYNYVYKVMEPIGWQIFLFYPRLWLLLLLYISYIWFIHLKLIKVHALSFPERVKAGY
ncbi:DUF2029 domain-containing protein [Rhodocytophaga rosea]|uniref:DUF2029 domain-containing protein n=1 Tax=Rhodocytophaga rosea TaxID=2704465 RepID=A0A6C0GNM0_9BACT|nr:glycosyltransferase family 87 protein [Rhodocytophaga rosea]QHT69635.1 DUF2029 domain-containing protein [Rhodocytophaga rosea]